MGISFSKAASQKIYQARGTPPGPRTGAGSRQIRRPLFLKVPLWGCPGLNFRANLPFDGMRPAYAAFEKEIPMALQSTAGFFNELKFYENSII